MSKLADILATPAIWPPLIAAIQSNAADADDDTTETNDRQLDLARLAWTCRSAYKAIHPHLWSTLRLVFRDRGDPPLALPLIAKDTPATAATATSLLDRHAQVVDASLFPHYNPSTTSATTASCHDSREKVKIQRIRAVSEFRYLYPFVVLGGKLYLATLHDKRRHAKANGSSPPVPVVPTSLWDLKQQRRSFKSGEHPLLDTRVVGGLLLVEYPLHLVTHITLDFCDPSIARRFECDHPNCKTDLTAKLPFLLFPTLTSQVTKFDFYAVNPRHCLGTLHHKLSHAYTGIQWHDWAVRRGGLRPTPTVASAATRHVRLLNDHSFNAAHPLRVVGMPQSQITHFELTGAGVFHFCWVRSQAFTSEALTTLSLDFYVDFANGTTPLDQGHVAYRLCMPALRQLVLTTSVANLLFPGDSPHYHAGEPITDECAFPQLARLTLIPNHTRHEILNQAPALPYTHMPNLTHFAVSQGTTSSNKLGKQNQSHGRFTFPGADLYMLLTHARHLSSLDLVGVARLIPAHSSPSSPTPVHLTRATLRTSHLRSMSTSFSLPNLDSLQLIVDTQDWTHDLPMVAPTTLARLTLQLSPGPTRFGPDPWKSVANALPRLTHLDICAYDHSLNLPAPKHSRDSAIDLGHGQGLLDIEELSVGAIAAEEQEEAAVQAVIMSHLTQLTITHPYVRLPSHITLPKLSSLETHIDRLIALTDHLPHISRIVIHGNISAAPAQHIFNLVSPSADIHFIPPSHSTAYSSIPATKPRDNSGGPLVFKFAGAQHARTWRKVLRACAWSAPDAPSGDEGKGGVKCVLAAGVEESEHAQLIGNVVQRLMGKHLGRVEVVCDSEVVAHGGKVEEYVRRVHEAIGGARWDGQGGRMDCEE